MYKVFLIPSSSRCTNLRVAHEALNRTVALAVVSLDERDEKARRAGNAAPHPAADNFELAVKTCGFLLGAILPRFNKLLSAIRHKKSLGSNTVTLLTDANNANGAGGGAVLSAARLEELDFTLAEVPRATDRNIMEMVE